MLEDASMKKIHIASNRVSDIYAGRNTLFLVFDEEPYVYTKINNWIHSGRLEDVIKIALASERVSYTPAFDPSKIKSQSDNKIHQIIFNLTEWCDLDCVYCINGKLYPGERMKNPKFMTWDVAKLALDYFIERHAPNPSISFYGGEPSLNQKVLKRILEYSFEHIPNIKFVMTSNFAYIRPLLPLLVDYNVVLNISIDGPKRIHDAFRLTRTGLPTYALILENMEELERVSPGYSKRNILVNGTCLKDDDFQSIVRSFVEFDSRFRSLQVAGIQKRKIDPIMYESFSSSTSAFDSYLTMGEEYLQYALSNSIPPTVLENLYFNNLRKWIFASKELTPSILPIGYTCIPGERELFVDTEGDYYACEKMGRCHKIGDVNSGMTPNINMQMLDSLARIRTEECSNCWAGRLCDICFEGAKGYELISKQGLQELCPSLMQSAILNMSMYISLLKLDPSLNSSSFFLKEKHSEVKDV